MRMFLLLAASAASLLAACSPEKPAPAAEAAAGEAPLPPLKSLFNRVV